ncbi:LAFE_0G15324g1_1 [Lachancea fermentati]|uniref:LAFE_0G15324g1_1 n=1 Tax=Lachancea fermentati TaxID=4955 RepID=A0A1G4MIJ8_LACFM|nr:LAFE_0G15324g1_1 [Lachancea fermentati]
MQIACKAFRKQIANSSRVANFMMSAIPNDQMLSVAKPGQKNQSVTKPISLDSATGEVLVRKSTGKAKIRKGQPEDEYERQKAHFFEVENGPLRTEANQKGPNDLLKKLENPLDDDLTLKQTRQRFTSECHRLYFKKEYRNCAAACRRLIELYESLENKRILKEIDELSYMLNKSEEKDRAEH